MSFLLDLFYLVAATVLSPLLIWRMLTREKYRTGLLDRLGIGVEPRQGSGPCIWIHSVSVGEVLAAVPLVRELEQAYPALEVVVSSTTSTGVEVARKSFPGRRVIFYPLDLSFAVRRVIDAIRPSLVVLVELELWPNFLARAARKRIPVVVVNGRISEWSWRWYKRLGWLIRRPLEGTRAFAVQTEEYARRFLDLGIPPERVLVTGNMKYDNLPGAGAGAGAADLDVETQAREYRVKLGLGADEPTLVAGSTHPPEERLVLGAYRRLLSRFKGLRLVIAPRHLERLAEVEAEVRGAGLECVRKTAIAAAAAAGAPGALPLPVIILDTMGELAKVYSVATAVFVGGSLVPHGGQNMLEPAGLGKPVLFGPHVANFRESAEHLLRTEAAVQVADEAALEAALARLLASPFDAAALGGRARASIQASRGAAARNAALLRAVVEEAGLLGEGATGGGPRGRGNGSKAEGTGTSTGTGTGTNTRARVVV